MRPLAVLAGIATAAAAGPARAVDRFELQVYEAEVNDPGQPGLELHLNGTLRGTSQPGYAGELPPWHVLRATLEPAVGIAEWLELGAYLQLMVAPGGDARFGGGKLRAKLVVPERVRRELGLPVFLGLNVELGKVPRAVEAEGWANELRPIVGWRGDRWLVSVNPIFGWALSGPDRLRVDLEPCGKVSWNTRLGFAVGAEYYASLGYADALLPARAQEHLLFGVLDLVEPGPPAPAGEAAARASPWELNLGMGGALTDAPGPHLVVKAIVGRAF